MTWRDATCLLHTGNLLVPNESYCKFEAWFSPLLHRLHDEQDASKRPWTPSTLIRRLGQEINDENSVYYWCFKVDATRRRRQRRR